MPRFYGCRDENFPPDSFPVPYLRCLYKGKNNQSDTCKPEEDDQNKRYPDDSWNIPSEFIEKEDNLPSATGIFLYLIQRRAVKVAVRCPQMTKVT